MTTLTVAANALTVDLRRMDAEGAIDLAEWPAASELIDAVNGTTEDSIQLIAKVLAWQDGIEPHDIESASQRTDYQDWAQQAAEDLGIA